MLMDKYIYLFEKASIDFDIDYNYLITQYLSSNRSMILKQNNIAIGFLVMDDIYYARIKKFVHFIKYIWLDNEYRYKHFGSMIISNIIKLKHSISNTCSNIILNVKKNDASIIFYTKNNFKKIDETSEYDMYQRNSD